MINKENTWLVVTTQGSVVLGMYGSALLEMAQECARKAERETGFPAFVSIVQGAKPSVGQILDAVKPIHHCSYASQPYVRFDCTGEEHYVYAGSTIVLPADVYSSDGGFYTFEKEKATCKACIPKEA